MARREQYVVGLDVGTSKVTAVVGELLDGDGLDVIGIGVSESRGIKLGVVVNLEAAVDSIKKAVASGGGLTRQKVTDSVFSTKDRKSVLGTYSIDKNGDTTLTDYGLYKLVNGQPTFDKVIKGTPIGAGG